MIFNVRLGWAVQQTTLSLSTRVEVELGCDKNIFIYRQVVAAYPEIIIKLCSSFDPTPQKGIEN